MNLLKIILYSYVNTNKDGKSILWSSTDKKFPNVNKTSCELLKIIIGSFSYANTNKIHVGLIESFMDKNSKSLQEQTKLIYRCHHALYYYIECHMLSSFELSVIMLSVVVLSVI